MTRGRRVETDWRTEGLTNSIRRNWTFGDEGCIFMSDKMKRSNNCTNGNEKKNDKRVSRIQSCKTKDVTKEVEKENEAKKMDEVEKENEVKKMDEIEKENEVKKMAEEKGKDKIKATNCVVSLFIDENKQNDINPPCNFIKSMSKRSIEKLKYLLKQKSNIINDDIFKKQILIKNMWVYFNFGCPFSLDDLILISRSFKNSEIQYSPIAKKEEGYYLTIPRKNTNRRRNANMHEDISEDISSNMDIYVDESENDDQFYNSKLYNTGKCKRKNSTIYCPQNYVTKNFVRLYFSNPFTVCYIYENGTLYIYSTRTLKEIVILLIKIVKKIKYKTFWTYCKEKEEAKEAETEKKEGEKERKKEREKGSIVDNLCDTFSEDGEDANENDFDENNCSRHNPSGSNDRGNDMSEINFDESNLSGVSLSGSNLCDSNINGSILCDNNISDNNISDSNIIGSSPVIDQGANEQDSLINCFLESENCDDQITSVNSDLMLDDIDENEIFSCNIEKEKAEEKAHGKAETDDGTIQECNEERGIAENKRSTFVCSDDSIFKKKNKNDLPHNIDPIDNINYCEQTILHLKKGFLKYKSDFQDISNEWDISFKKRDSTENIIHEEKGKQKKMKTLPEENPILQFSEKNEEHIKNFPPKKNSRNKQDWRKAQIYKCNKYYKWKYITRKDISLDFTQFFIQQFVAVFNLKLIHFHVNLICKYEELKNISKEIHNFIYIQINKQLLNILLHKYATGNNFMRTPYAVGKDRDEQETPTKIVHLYHTGSIIIYACTNVQEIITIERFLVDTFKRNKLIL